MKKQFILYLLLLSSVIINAQENINTYSKLGFERNDGGPGYIYNLYEGGYLTFVTNGRTTSDTNASLVLRADKSARFYGNVDLLSETNENTLLFGRNLNENLKFYVNDFDAFIDYKQDSDNDATHILYIRNQALGSSPNNDIRFRTSGLDRLTIKSNGNIGIGTTAPLGNKLFVNGNTRISGSITASQMIFSNSNTHLSIYEDSDIPNWALLRSNIGEGIAIIGQPDVVSIAVSRTNSNVGIGTRNIDSRYKLAVNGTIRSKEVVVETGWSDFVFHPTYKLKTLEEVEQFIKTNKHLPDVPSEKEVKENGLSLGQSDAVLLQKIEELTLYLIEQNKEVKSSKEQAESLKVQNQKLINKMLELEEKIENLETTK